MSGNGKGKMPITNYYLSQLNTSTNPSITDQAGPSSQADQPMEFEYPDTHDASIIYTPDDIKSVMYLLAKLAEANFSDSYLVESVSKRAQQAILEFNAGEASGEDLVEVMESIKEDHPEIFSEIEQDIKGIGDKETVAPGLGLLVKAGDSHLVDMGVATVAANRTVGREDASGQLNPAKRIANWIIHRSQICGSPIPSEVITASQTFLDRWPDTFIPGHPGRGTATCWICGQPIKHGDHSEIEHVLGMRPSAYRFTALCTPTTLEFGGLTQYGWRMLTHAPMSKLKDTTQPLNELDKLLCKVKWNCIYDFLYNYAPAHRCCNQVKGNINEMSFSFLTRPIQISGINLPLFIPDRAAIKYLLENIIARIKEGKQWSCNELKDYLTLFESPNWVKQRILTIINDYLNPLREPNTCLEDSPMGLLAQTIIAREARNMDFIEANNESMINYTRSINGTNPTDPLLNLPGLPFYYNHKSPNEPTFQLLAYHLGITAEELRKRLDSGDPTAIKKLIEMRWIRKKWEDKKTKEKEHAKKRAATKKVKKELTSAISKKPKTIKKTAKQGGKRRYTKKLHFTSNLHKNTRKAKKKSKRYKKKYNKK